MPDEPLDAVADADLRAALLFARSQDGPITADDAAVALEGEAIEFPPRRFDELVAALVEELPEAALRRAGAQFGRQLAAAAGLRPVRDLVRGLSRVCTALRSLGYQTSLVSVEDGRVVLS